MYSFEHYDGVLGSFDYNTYDFVVTNMTFIAKASCAVSKACDLDKSIDSRDLMLKFMRYQRIDPNLNVTESEYSEYLSDDNVDYKHDCLCYVGNFEKTIRLPDGCIDTTAMFTSRYIPADVKLDGFDKGNIKRMAHMFEEADLSTVRNFSKLNIVTNRVTDMSAMFGSCIFPADFEFGNKFITTNVRNMYAMFRDAYAPGYFSLGFNTKNVTSMREMFANFNAKDTIMLSLCDEFDTSNVRDMIGMFYNIDARNKNHMMLDLGLRFDTSSLEDCSNMFESAKLPDGFTLGDKFSCENIQSMEYMFSDAVLPLNFAVPSDFAANVPYKDDMFTDAKYANNEPFDINRAIENFGKKKTQSKKQLTMNDIFGF